MKKLAFTTAIALALATAAYAQGHHGGGGGGGGMGGGGGGGAGVSAHGPSMGGSGGGPGPGLSAQHAPGGSANGMGATRGTSGLFNRAPSNQNFDRDRNRFSDRDRDFDRSRDRFSGHDRGSFNRDRDFQHRGIARGNFFEHGRHFGFRRFFRGQVVFLTSIDDCTAWAWVHVAPGTWAWRPINICIG